MYESRPGPGASLAVASGERRQTALYVYCLARTQPGVRLGAIGIEDREVYTLGRDGLCAIVHDCPPQPYQSPDDEAAAGWVLAHHLVVDAAWRRWSTVLPVAFNTIIRTEQGNAEQNLMAWLDGEHEMLLTKLAALAGKAEYAVQVFWDPALMGKKIAEASLELKTLEEEARAERRGLAYMHRQRLETLLKRQMEAKAAEEFQGLYARISPWADNILVEKAKQGERGLQMLMNLSCLVSRQRYPDLVAALDSISKREGFSVRLVGPVPPYSFC